MFLVETEWQIVPRRLHSQILPPPDSLRGSPDVVNPSQDVTLLNMFYRPGISAMDFPGAAFFLHCWTLLNTAEHVLSPGISGGDFPGVAFFLHCWTLLNMFYRPGISGGISLGRLFFCNFFGTLFEVFRILNRGTFLYGERFFNCDELSSGWISKLNVNNWRVGLSLGSFFSAIFLRLYHKVFRILNRETFVWEMFFFNCDELSSGWSKAECGIIEG